MMGPFFVCDPARREQVLISDDIMGARARMGVGCHSRIGNHGCGVSFSYGQHTKLGK